MLQYTDAQTDDAMLVQAVMNSAMDLGADLLCPATFTSAKRISGGVEVFYDIGGSKEHFTSRVIVNAAGPWAAELLDDMVGGLPTFPVDKVQGTHIELEGEITKGCYYLEVPEDKRAVFVMRGKGELCLVRRSLITKGILTKCIRVKKPWII